MSKLIALAASNPTVLAAEECDLTQPICAPENVTDLFVLPGIFGSVNRTIILMFLAALIVVAFLYFGLRNPKVLPSKFQSAVEAVISFIRDDVAVGILGADGLKFFPYLLSVFLFILVGNLFEVTPFINFPITSRMAIPAFLTVISYVLFVGVGFRRHGVKYLTGVVWPSSVPIALRPLVGVIEFASVFLIRPFALAVRLFANMVAGHTMLSLLLVTGVVFVSEAFTGGVTVLKGAAGVAWFGFGLAIYAFEIVVSILQAYIFTLLSTVYIETSIHAEH